MDDVRALLNSLMGADRDKQADQRRERKFTDDDICKEFLLGLCPHELFEGTKIWLGPCSKYHNETFKEQFEADLNAPRYRRRWRPSLKSQLKSLLQGVDRRIGQNEIRIAAEKEGPTGPEQKRQQEALNKEVAEKLKLAEKAADDGKFEDSRNIMKDAEALKRKGEDLGCKKYEKYKKENICEICGLIIDDEEAEAMKTGRGWHSNGKQHIGYALIREFLVKLDKDEADDRKNSVRTKTASRSPPRGKKEDKSSKARERSKSEPRRRDKTEDRKHKAQAESGSRRRGASRRRSRSRSREKDRRGTASSKKRASSRKRSRSRSRDRKVKRSRSRSRRKKSRSRSREKKIAAARREAEAAKERAEKEKAEKAKADRETEKDREKELELLNQTERDKEKDKEKKDKEKKKSKKEKKGSDDDKERKSLEHGPVQEPDKKLESEALDEPVDLDLIRRPPVKFFLGLGK